MNNSVSTNRTVTPKSAMKAIDVALRHRRPLMLWGAAGIGKSDIVHQVAAQSNRKVRDVRLALWDPTDIKGIPYRGDDNLMHWSVPIELPTDPDCTDVLFLDELPSAPPATQAAAYQLVLNRRVGNYVLPAGVDIVAAGNRRSDKGVTHEMPAPLANRFVHLELETSFEDFQEWAINNNISSQVLGYLSFKKDDLHKFDPKSISRSFPSPRSWSFVSQLVQDENCDERTLTDLVSGCIGDGTAVQFMAHRKICHKLPSPTDILEGKVTKVNTDEMSALSSLNVSLCYELNSLLKKIGRNKKWYAYVDKYLEFIMSGVFEAELVVVGFKILMTTYNMDLDPSKLTQYSKFKKEYGSYILSA